MTQSTKIIQSNRAPFSKDLSELRQFIINSVATLDQAELGYASAYFERKNQRLYSVNLKQSTLNEHVSSGLVLRLYNGYTLFEESTDNFDPENIERSTQRLIARVKGSASPRSALRSYKAPIWKERLAQHLEEEITSQIPPEVNAKTPVHFGISYKLDSASVSSRDAMESVSSILAKAKVQSTKVGFSESEIQFLVARMQLVTEESIFIDKESNLSQTLLRSKVTVVAMNSGNRVHLSVGGLGGMECIEINDEKIFEMFRDLKALQTAEHLKPGTYDLLCAPAITGVLAHEAFGHSQEADTCARGRSRAWELYKSGELVGNELATIVNNPAVFKNALNEYAAWGSTFFDEEGWLASEHTILDRGKLCAPMTNLTSALRLNIPRTANGKREDWSHGVYTRQTNTYFSAGKETYAEILAMMKDGFLATHCAGGMEDPKGMGIQVGILFLHEVKNGALTGKVLKGPAGGDIQLTGFVPDILNNIIAKSKVDFDSTAPDRSRFPLNDTGGCGKYHKEYVNAGSGGPYMLIKGVTLG